MKNKLKILIILISLLSISGFCFADNKTKSPSSNKKILKAPEIKNYEVIIPPVLALDSRTALTRNEINIVDKQKFKILQKYP